MTTDEARFARLIGEGLEFSFDYRDGLTNHDLMALTAQHRLSRRLSLSSDRLEPYAAAYRTRLEPVRESDLAFEAAFAPSISARGFTAVATEALVELGPALPAAAGHGLLAVYFALEARPDLPVATFERHLARALGHYRDRAVRLYDGPRGQEPFASVLRALPELDGARHREIRALSLITLRQAAAARTPEFVAAASRACPPPDVLEVARVLARVAVVDPNFTLLHGLTTAQAILDLPGLLPELDVAPLLRGHVDFVLAACLTERLETAVARAIDVPSTPPIDRDASLAAVAAAIATTRDDHAPKAAFSLLRFYDRTGDPVFLAAAESFVRRYGGGR